MDKIDIRLITKDTVPLINEVLESVYCDRYGEIKKLSLEKQWQQHCSKDNIIALAFCVDKAVGMISLKRSLTNCKLYELGMLSVVKEFRTGVVASKLSEFAKNEFSHLADFEAVFLENVSSHYYTQRKSQKNGGVDSAIALSAMPELEKENQRLVFIVAFFENKNALPKEIYLPKNYADIMLFFYQGLQPRKIMPACYEKPSFGQTNSIRCIYSSIGLVKEIINFVGCDFKEKIIALEHFTQENAIETMQFYLPLNTKFVSYAVDCLNERGFFIGGVLPFWFGGDGLLMQKVNSPQWEKLCLYSKKSKFLFDLIYKDYLRVQK